MTVSLRYAVEHIDILDRSGFPKNIAYDILGIAEPNHETPNIRLSGKKLNAVFNKAEKALSDPLIGLRVGYEFRVANFQETGIIYSCCKDLNQVIHYNIRYQPLAINIAKISNIIEIDKTSNHKRYFIDYTLFDETLENSYHLLNMVFAAYGTAFRWLTWGSAKDLKAVYFQYPEPPDISFHTKVFQCPVYFSQKYNRIEFYEDCMSAPLTTHDPVRLAQCVAKLEDFSSSNQAKTAFLDSLRLTIEHGIASNRHNLSSVAKSMGLHEAKFKEELKLANIKYRDYVDSIKKDMFIQKYRAGMSFTTIAFELGYNDQSAFTKAFKRWYGQSPRSFKQKNQSQEPA